MNHFGDLYSLYYDLIYQNKNYSAEVDYVDNLIKSYFGNAKTILDLGCGTGIHARMFCDKGYSVHGADLSESMLERAEIQRKGREDKLFFTHSNIQDLDLDIKFDVVVSLFHVMSYQTTNSDLNKCFEVAKKHLNKGGIFIFDFWYGPAVLTDLPVTRVKRFENDHLKVTRIAEPTLIAADNLVKIDFDLFLENKENKEIASIHELHEMRYLFDNELEIICDNNGLNVVSKLEWLGNKKPGFKSWYAVWIVKV